MPIIAMFTEPELEDFVSRIVAKTVKELNQFPEWMTRKEAANFLGVSKSTVNIMVKPVKIGGVRPPARLKINELGLISKEDLIIIRDTKY